MMAETIRHLTSSGCQINGMQTVTDHVPTGGMWDTGTWDGWMDDHRRVMWICGCDGRSCIHNVAYHISLGPTTWHSEFLDFRPSQVRT